MMSALACGDDMTCSPDQAEARVSLRHRRPTHQPMIVVSGAARRGCPQHTLCTSINTSAQRGIVPRIKLRTSDTLSVTISPLPLRLSTSFENFDERWLLEVEAA